MRIDPQYQCSATNRRGERCELAKMPGATVCHFHGAKAPQVIRAAKERLIRGADYAIDCILDIIKVRPPCPTCQRVDDPKVQLRASQVLLDRAGLGPTSTIEIDDKNAKDQAWAKWLSETQLNQIAEWILEAKLKEEQQQSYEAQLLAAQVEEQAFEGEGSVH
jgi:hypothetical protein